MKQSKLGICFYPTTIALIDDNKEYLKHLTPRLIGKEQLPCLTYDDAQKALRFFTEEYQADPFLNHCLINKDAGEYDRDRLVAELDIRAIHQEIYNARRFKEVTVLIIDYAMPHINGLDFCRQIRKRLSNNVLKIVMLTGEASQELAVQAFNEGIIDKFILKATPTLMEGLVQTVRELQTSYFLSLSEMVLSRVRNSSLLSLACINDPVFIEFFHQLCEKNKITEYYLLNEYGSYLLLNNQGKPSWLIVANSKLMEGNYQFAEYGDNVPESILSLLKNKEKIPYFHTEQDWKTPPAQWEKYMHSVQVLPGKETYYYAYITDPNAYDIQPAKILSYQQFMGRH